jgi:lipopolysaccharide/colanic/teichoic acid biosynthesis glycosyltransferase
VSAFPAVETAPATAGRLSVIAKREVDVCGALLGLLLLAPVMLTIALAIRLTSPGPAIFRQRRAGQGHRPFVMWKFRTMVDGADRMRAELVAHVPDDAWLDLERDPRVTRAGRILRRCSLDELPQLVNVLRGDMSLVGPRPLPLDEHARIPEWASARVAVRPGLTGPWQVAGRESIGFLDMLRLDCQYVGRQSLWEDLKILARTLPAVLDGKGAK